MSDWKEYTLEELCDFQNGFAFKNSDYVNFSENTHEVFRMGYINRGGGFKEDSTPVFVSKDYYRNLEKFLLIPNDITIAMTDMKNSMALLGYCARISQANRFVLNQRVGRIRVLKEDLLDPIFLYYYLNSPKQIEYLRANSNSGVQVNLGTETIKQSILRIPNLEEQRKIANILFCLDKKIQLNTQINQTLEQIAQAIFKSWFVDFDPVRAKAEALAKGKTQAEAELAAMQIISGKTPEELTALSQTHPDQYAELAEIARAFPSEFEEVEGFGEVPRGWEVQELGSLMTIKRGSSPRPIKDFISETGLNWIKISDATAEDNPFLFSTKEYIKPEGLSKTVLLKQGSLILSNSATPGLPRFLEIDACIHDGWLYFSEIKELSQEYLYFFFIHIRENLVSQGNGSVFTNLKTDIVKSQKCIVPSDNVMGYFNILSKKMMKLIRENTYSSIILKETRDLLLPRLLNGEI
ncbi:restriction endonuclease subunit S [Rodentibacter ratti]|uniref:restriction endonuclease subunit S n=1 Tax=Rodentibacter ratti TaxID=1906745 RepID=UPI000985CBCE|nr:restriction endonuclease subunit S [Rodentibacter ratti]OOF87870.1 restriction endonuclease subunit S [Rodentibacter ratti]